MPDYSIHDGFVICHKCLTALTVPGPQFYNEIFLHSVAVRTSHGHAQHFFDVLSFLQHDDFEK